MTSLRKTSWTTMRERWWNTLMTSWSWRRPASPPQPKGPPLDVQETQASLSSLFSVARDVDTSRASFWSVKGAQAPISPTPRTQGWPALLTPASRLPSRLPPVAPHTTSPSSHLPSTYSDLPAPCSHLPVSPFRLEGQAPGRSPLENQYYILSKKNTTKRGWVPSCKDLLRPPCSARFSSPFSPSPGPGWMAEGWGQNAPGPAGGLSSACLLPYLAPTGRREGGGPCGVQERGFSPTLLHLPSPAGAGGSHSRAIPRKKARGSLVRVILSTSIY